ncbi:hypothetical protein N9302_00855 [bacterium]|nr:hypothetical protein [bacterium]
MPKRILFIPLETISRELDAKLVLAHQVMDKDTICFFGQHDMIDSISQLFKNGVYVGKNIFKTYFPVDLRFYNTYKKNNHEILWLHEEGGIYPGDPTDWNITLRELLDASCLGRGDQILTWGDFQKDYYNMSASTNVLSVGSPRLNLLNGSLLRKLIQKFNRVTKSNFILVNTNFSVANHISSTSIVLSDLMHGHDSLSDHHRVIQGYAEEKKILSYFIEALSELAYRHPDEQFVIRPHPTEAMELYVDAFKIYANVTISKDYTAVEWIEKCNLLIQNGCTTAIEAHLMEKRVINFYPFESKNLINVTRDLGEDVTNFSELESAIFSSNSLPVTRMQNEGIGINKLINNLKNDYDESLLINVIKKAVDDRQGIRFNRMFVNIRIYTMLVIKTIFRAIKFYPRFLYTKKYINYQTAIEHYPGMNKKDLTAKMDFLSSESEKDVKVKFFNNELAMFYIDNSEQP